MKPKPDVEALWKHIAATGKDPEMFPVLREPELYSDIKWVWEAFLTLSSGRNYHFGGPGPISVSDILAIANFYGIENFDDLEEFSHYIRAMDMEWLKYQASQQKSNQK